MPIQKVFLKQILTTFLTMNVRGVGATCREKHHNRALHLLFPLRRFVKCEQQPHQCTIRARQRFEYREMVHQWQAQQTAWQRCLRARRCIRVGLALQLGQLCCTTGQHQRRGARGQISQRTQTLHVIVCELQLVIQIVEPHRRQIENTADRQPAADRRLVHYHGRHMAARRACHAPVARAR